MEKRAVVTSHNTPDLKKSGTDILKKHAAAFNAYMDKVMGEMSASAKLASAEDAKTFEDESK